MKNNPSEYSTYHLSLDELNLCKTKKSKTNQLTFGIMLVYFREHFQFPPDEGTTISTLLVLQVAKNLDIDPRQVAAFEGKIRTVERYRQDIRQYLGYRVANAQDIGLVTDYLVNNV